MALRPLNFPLPQSPFDVRPLDDSTPAIGDGMNQPTEPFVWGAGGARLTPEQILAREELAQGQMQSDFSPVGHWTQGLGRVVDNVMGALDMRRLDRAEQANKAESDAVTQALLSGGGDNAVLMQAMVNPYISPEVRDMAGIMFKAQQPKQRNPFEFEQMLEAGGYQPGTPEYQQQVRSMIERKNDPFITANLPSGDFYAGPQSGFGQLLKGGDPQISPQPGAGGNPAPATAGPGVPHLTVEQMRSIGQGVNFSEWQRREGTPVLITTPEEMAQVPSGTMVISLDGRRGVKK